MAPLMTFQDSPPKCTVTICFFIDGSAALITYVLYTVWSSMLCLILEVVTHLDIIDNTTDITNEQYHALHMTKWFLILGSLLKTTWSRSWGRASWVRGRNSEYRCPGKGTVIIIWCWNYQDRPFTTRLHWTVHLKCLFAFLSVNFTHACHTSFPVFKNA